MVTTTLAILEFLVSTVEAKKTIKSLSVVRALKTQQRLALLGPGFDEHGIVDAVEKVVAVYLGEREEGEEFLATYRRIGAAPFKEAVYDAD